MRALLWLDPGAQAVAGHVVQGHIVQAERTAAALAAFGVSAVVSADADAAFRDFDVVHGLGVGRSTLREVRRAGIPTAQSTIYWSSSYTLGSDRRSSGWRHATSVAEHRARVTASVLRRGPGHTARSIADPLLQRALDFECVDILLPNSEAEAVAIKSELSVSTPTHVVPNGVDPGVFYPPSTGTVGEYVLSVARIEPHKNQLGLIRALKATGLPLVLAGPPHPHHPDYYQRCREEGEGRVVFEEARSHDELRELYQRARVHVLASYFETTGLVSLEAALAGCNIVSTDRGYAHEYLVNLADYLDPSDDVSIRSAVQRAWARPRDGVLRERVLSRYTWEMVARATAEAYAKIVDR